MGRIFGLVAIVFVLGAPQRSESCTTVALPNSKEKIVAKSYDYPMDHGTAFINLRGLRKTALTPGAKKPLRWKSEYGSFTYTQIAREFPFGGINEKGLVVEIMNLAESKYPGPDERPVVNELQWIQYTLDRFETTAAVVKNANRIRVANSYGLVHYMVCDAKLECATFEYLKGKLVIHTGSDLVVPTLTNDPYRISLRYLQNHAGFGGKLAVPKGPGSLARFARASSMAAGFDPRTRSSAVADAFSILQSVGPTAFSRFHLVYEASSPTVHFKSWVDRAKIKDVRLSYFSLGCSKEEERTKMFDMNQSVDGDIATHFTAYNEAQNKALVERGLKDIKKSLPPDVDKRIAQYPRTLVCEK